ncbi:MAG: F0F1 ATP synthase subunit epsilon [Alphaproteobacteria bacterium]
MKDFSLTLLDSTQTQKFEGVTQCVAADATGSFGLLAGHENLVAVLRYGLLRFCDSAGKWRYAALPGGILRFAGNTLSIVTSRYFAGDEREKLVTQLAEEMARENSDIRNARATLAQIEQTLIRRLGELSEGRRL